MPRRKKSRKTLYENDGVEFTICGSRAVLSFEVDAPGMELRFSRRHKAIDFTSQLDWAFCKVVESRKPLPMFRKGTHLRDDLTPIIVKHLGRSDLHSFMQCNRWSLCVAVTIRGSDIRPRRHETLPILVAAGCPLDRIGWDIRDNRFLYTVYAHQGLWPQALKIYGYDYENNWVQPPRDIFLSPSSANPITTMSEASYRKLLRSFTSMLDREVVEALYLHKQSYYTGGSVADWSFLIDRPHMPYQGVVENLSLLLRPGALEWFRRNPTELRPFINKDSPVEYIQLYIDIPAAQEKSFMVNGYVHIAAIPRYEDPAIIRLIYSTKWLLTDYITQDGRRISQFLHLFL